MIMFQTRRNLPPVVLVIVVVYYFMALSVVSGQEASSRTLQTMREAHEQAFGSTTLSRYPQHRYLKMKKRKKKKKKTQYKTAFQPNVFGHVQQEKQNGIGYWKGKGMGKSRMFKSMKMGGKHRSKGMMMKKKTKKKKSLKTQKGMAARNPALPSTKGTFLKNTKGKYSFWSQKSGMMKSGKKGMKSGKMGMKSGKKGMKSMKGMKGSKSYRPQNPHLRGPPILIMADFSQVSTSNPIILYNTKSRGTAVRVNLHLPQKIPVHAIVAHGSAVVGRQCPRGAPFAWHGSILTRPSAVVVCHLKTNKVLGVLYQDFISDPSLPQDFTSVSVDASDASLLDPVISTISYGPATRLDVPFALILGGDLVFVKSPVIDDLADNGRRDLATTGIGEPCPLSDPGVERLPQSRYFPLTTYVVDDTQNFKIDGCNAQGLVVARVNLNYDDNRGPTRSPTTATPTLEPAPQPTRVPTTRLPTQTPNIEQSQAPVTKSPTRAPVLGPNSETTLVPTRIPTPALTTFSPTRVATTSAPVATGTTNLPSTSPSSLPSVQPSEQPSVQPSVQPSAQPSELPTEFIGRRG